MGAAYFYHLTRSPVEATLPNLLAKSLQNGWRVAIRATAPDRLRWLDDKLWTAEPDSFLPHGVVGSPHDAAQPILLTTATTLPNAATCLMSIDSAAVTATEVQSLDRVCILFDGNDPEALATARSQWKSLTDAGCSAQYWSEETGRWQKKAER